MDPRLDWLDNCIDLMQTDRSLGRSTGAVEYEPDAEDIAMLQVAARLNANRPGAGTPDGHFIERLRARVLVSVLE